MVIGVTSFQIHLPESRSLKDKRQVLRRVKDRLRAHHNVAVLEEAEHASLWQRAEVVVVSVAGNRDVLVRLFDGVRREVEAHVPGHVMESEPEFLDVGGA